MTVKRSSNRQNVHHLFCLGSLLLCSTTAGATSTDGFSDWVSDPSSICGGYYQPPPLPAMPDDPDEAQSLRISADQSKVHLNGHTLLMGDVAIEQGVRRVEADEAQIEHEPNTRNIQSITASGHVRFIQPGMQVTGASASADKNTGHMQVNDASYRLYDRHARGAAAIVSVDDNKVSTLNEASYTTCPPLHDTWLLEADKVELDPNKGRGKAWGAQLKVEGIPVLYAPYFNFPIDDRRMSGFLFPSFGQSDKHGLYFTVPYYFNLAPNYDAQLTPKYYEKRGVGLDGTVRYLTEESNGRVDIETIFHDDAYAQFRHLKRRSHPLITNPNDPRLLGLSGLHRALLHFEHETQFTDNLSLDINYNRVSDDNYFTDLEQSIIGSNVSQLEQTFRMDYASDEWDGYARFQEYQVLHPFEGATRAEIYRRQPQVFLSKSDFPIAPGLMFAFDSEFARFNIHKDRLTNTSQTHGDRWRLRPSISYPIEQPGWFVTPGMKLDTAMYRLARGTADIAANKPNKPSRTIPIFDTRAGMWFDRETQLGQVPFVQTLEPQLYYVYVPYVDQDPYPNFDSGPTTFSLERLWRDDRFSGGDRVGDTHQVSLGVTSRLMDMSQYFERARVTLGQIFYLKERKVTVCDQSSNAACRLLEDPSADDSVSPAVAEVGGYLTPSWYTQGTLEFNHQIGETDRASISAEYRGPNDAIFNFGFQYLRIDPSRTDESAGNVFSLNQVSSSVFVPLSDRWRLMGRAYYDRSEHHLIDALAGFEYESCCFAVQFVAQRYLRAGGAEILTQPRSVTGIDPYDNVFSLQVTLKGLSTLGLHDRDESLKKLIPGYRSFGSRMRPSTARHT